MVRQKSPNPHRPGGRHSPHRGQNKQNKIHKNEKQDKNSPAKETGRQKLQKSIPLGKQSNIPLSKQKNVMSSKQSQPMQSITQSAKQNLAKLASINKLMAGSGNSEPPKSQKPKLATSQKQKEMQPAKISNRPSPKQVTECLEALKNLQSLLDSYEDIQCDNQSTLKEVIAFIEARKPVPSEKNI